MPLPSNVALVGGNTQALGRVLYTQYLLPFELISMVLTVGVLGAIVLALPERLGLESGRRRDTISLGHPRGTDAVLPLESGDEATRYAPRTNARTGRCRTNPHHGNRSGRSADEYWRTTVMSGGARWN